MNYRITVTGMNPPVQFECGSQESLLDAMGRQGIFMSASCVGRGICGKCRIKLLKGEIKVTSFDLDTFSARELEEGFRLACKAYPSTDCTIKLGAAWGIDFDVVSDSGADVGQAADIKNDCAIAIDIGTTTIVIGLVDMADGKVLKIYKALNKQMAYGTDVAARMQESNSGKSEKLKKSILTDLLVGIESILRETGISPDQIKKLVIAGNTTMGHLLMGYSCSTLGRYPFIPVSIDTLVLPFEKLTGSDILKAPVIILPGISAFIGGDITAGLLTCNFDSTEKINLFIDLGTNTEMAVGNKDRLLLSSAAAGPAFEGGSISCGVGSIAGAICNIDIADGKLHYRTIGDKVPVGICGTGIIELVYELYRNGRMDETGLLAGDYFEHGVNVAKDGIGKPIVFTQNDVREVQLAKAAVRAGIEILIKRYGADYDKIDTVYLAGGFGYKLNIDKAAGIGLLPEELTGRVEHIGNSSFGGAVNYLSDDSAPKRIKHLLEISNEIYLAEDKDFNDLYMKYINF